MKPKPIRMISRAAMMLLMMVLTTGTVWAADITQNTAVVINSGNKATYHNKSIAGTVPSSSSAGTFTVQQWYYSSGAIVVDGIELNLTIDGFNADYHNEYAMRSGISLVNNATLHLTVKGTNTLKAGFGGAGIAVPAGCTLEITSASTGTLNATGGESYGGGAGIGSIGNHHNTQTQTGSIYPQGLGTIIINGGTINAQGGTWYFYNSESGGAAGIGSSEDSGATTTSTEYGSTTYLNNITGSVTINGGTVSATGGYSAAGIGGGNTGTLQAITINGGTVTATPGTGAAAISTGWNSFNTGRGSITGATINITGGTVTPNGSVGFGDAVVASQNVGGSVTVSDNANLPKHTITYVLNGGNNAQANHEWYFQAMGVASFANPSRTGYNFSGWYDNAGFNGSPITSIPANSTDNKTLYAKWTPITYTITYEPNSGTMPASYPTTFTIETPTFNLPTPTRTGYNFIGWYNNAGFNGTAVTTIATGSTVNKTLYAKWERAWSGTTSDGLTWTLSGTNHTELTISGTGAMKNYNHTTVDGLWRTDAPWGWETLTKITIGNGVTSIGDFAFIGCENVASVTIGSGVTSIGIGAINHCDQMTSVTLPASVTTIAYAAFENCQKLETIYINHDGEVSLTGNHDNAFNAPLLQTINFPSVYGAAANYATTGNWSGYKDKLRPLSHITLNDGLTITSTVITEGSNTYVHPGTTVTVSTSGVTVPTGVTYNGGITVSPYAAVTDNQNGTYSFFAPASDEVTISAIKDFTSYNINYDLAGGSLPTGMANPSFYTIDDAAFTLVNPVKDGYYFTGWTGTDLTKPTMRVVISQGSTGIRSYTATWSKELGPISYIDENGEEQTKQLSEYTVLMGGETSLQPGWYVVPSNIAYTSTINCTDGDVNIIILDGKTMTVGTSNNKIDGEGFCTNALSIYGQGNKSGKLSVAATGNGISANGNVTVSSCEVEATANNWGINAGADLTIDGSSVTATGTVEGGLSSYGNIIIKNTAKTEGMKVKASGTSGISASGNVSIEGCEVEATANNFGINVGADLTIDGSSVTATGTVEGGLFSYGNIIIKNTAKTEGMKVTASGTDGISAFGNVSIEDCEVEATGTSGDGIVTSESDATITLTGAKVTAMGTGSGIKADYGALIITGGNVTAASTATTGSGYGLYADGNLTVQTNETYPTVTVTATGKGDYAAIYSANGDISMTGATVTATANNWGINAGADLTIDGSSVTATGTVEGGLSSYGNIIIKNTAKTEGMKVTASGTSGISASGNVSIEGCEVEATANNLGINAGADLTIDGSSVTATGTVDGGLFSYGNIIIKNTAKTEGMKVTASGTDGISASGNVSIEDCEVEATGTSGDGIVTSESDATITLTGAKVTAMGTGSGIKADYGALIITGGNVTAASTATGSGYGLYADGNLTVQTNETYPTVTVTATGKGDYAAIYSANGDISMTGATVTATANNWGINAGADLTIDGSSVTATGTKYEGLSSYGNIIIKNTAKTEGMKVTASGTRGISAYGNVSIEGCEVEATGTSGYGIESSTAITLDWTTAADRIFASSYSGTVNIAAGKTFIDEDGTLHNSDNVGAIDGMTLIGVDVLEDAAENDVAALNGKKTNVALSGRTLYKDGAWNTLVLPFDVTVGSGQMEGATAMTLNGETSGFVASSGVLTLNFDNVAQNSTIEAGTPFIVKWTGEDVTSPVFSGVTVSSTEAGSVLSTDGYVTFQGTYDKQEYTSEDKSILFLGDENTLYWPLSGATIGAFRAYFHVDLNGGENAVRSFVLNFGDSSESTGIREIDTDPAPRSAEGRLQGKNPSPTGVGRNAAWYTLDGRKLSGKPTKSGVYIHNGRKVVIK